MTATTEVKAWIADLAAYNNGSLEGFWMDCTADADEMRDEIQEFLDKQTEKHGELREEYAVHDWDNPLGDWGEWPDWDEVAKSIEIAEEIGEDFLRCGLNQGLDLDDITDKVYGIFDSVEDFGYAQMEGSELETALNEFGGSGYFDYESYGRDCLHSYYWENIGDGQEIVVLSC